VSAPVETRQRGWRLAVKMLFDRVTALVVLLLASPMLLLIALLVRIKLGSPVLFRQIRPGKEGRLFEIVKFRTMQVPEDESTALATDAQRMTKFGSWLRSASLDELPQFWNVLRGELSLVGPRPLLIQYLDRYSPRQARRHEVLPGITGWAQVCGRNDATWEQKLEWDVWYVENWSLALDARIIARTFWQVLKREGVSLPGHATTVEFMGSAPASERNAAGEKQL